MLDTVESTKVANYEAAASNHSQQYLTNIFSMPGGQGRSCFYPHGAYNVAVARQVLNNNVQCEECCEEGV